MRGKPQTRSPFLLSGVGSREHSLAFLLLTTLLLFVCVRITLWLCEWRRAYSTYGAAQRKATEDLVSLSLQHNRNTFATCCNTLQHSGNHIAIHTVICTAVHSARHGKTAEEWVALFLLRPPALLPRATSHTPHMLIAHLISIHAFF